LERHPSTPATQAASNPTATTTLRSAPLTRTNNTMAEELSSTLISPTKLADAIFNCIKPIAAEKKVQSEWTSESPHHHLHHHLHHQLVEIHC
jgi:hypothetical protein